MPDLDTTLPTSLHTVHVNTLSVFRVAGIWPFFFFFGVAACFFLNHDRDRDFGGNSVSHGEILG